MENETTQEIAQKIIAWIESSTDIVKSQWPDFVDQYMRACLINTWISVFAAIMLAVIFIPLAFYAVNCCCKNGILENPIHYILSFVSPIISLLACVGLYSEIKNLVTIYIAPKVYILSHLKDFIR